MKNISISILSFLFVLSGYSQGSFDIFGTLANPYTMEYSFITLDSLHEAATLNDLSDAKYRDEWVATYNEVVITSNCGNGVKTAIGKDDKLTPEQLDLLRNADMKCKIDIVLDYIPNNTLKDNPARKIKDSFTMIPSEVTCPRM